ncbi:MAG TPA: biotin/lipoyl-containing protein [Vicinamibacteria bacterium]|nr:biotin/lipoyl-containing protein [Vicinamibacteria bacterium]
MTTPVVMPQMGESLSEGTITKWYKKSGEPIERDEPLFEITTDKVDTDVPSPVSGVVERILVADGETVDVGTVVALIAESKAKASAGDTGGHFRGSHEPKTF